MFRGWLGDRSQYSGFKFGDMSWQADPANPVGIDKKGALIQGKNVDGVVPDDQRRSGGFVWPPPKENYVWAALGSAFVEAELLYRAGYPDVYAWSDSALLRAITWLNTVDGFPAQGDDGWVPWLANAAYGTAYPAPARTSGKAMGWTDWTHAAPVSGVQLPAGSCTDAISDAHTHLLAHADAHTFSRSHAHARPHTDADTPSHRRQRDRSVGQRGCSGELGSDDEELRQRLDAAGAAVQRLGSGRVPDLHDLYREDAAGDDREAPSVRDRRERQRRSPVPDRGVLDGVGDHLVDRAGHRDATDRQHSSVCGWNVDCDRRVQDRDAAGNVQLRHRKPEHEQRGICEP